MSDERPNILLIMTDQQRGDCLGIEGHPVLQTPYLDHVGASGARFSHAYSACPVSVAARRTLMTGTRPCTHGVLSNYNTDLPFPTLPGELSKAGYQTHLVGKLHLHPVRKLYGFNSADYANSPSAGDELTNDYKRFLQREGLGGLSQAHGMNGNGWAARPWHLDERYHFSNWCATTALEFLQRRDPTVPFFLKLSFLHPHQPLTPPQMYYDRYMAMDLPEPFVGDWARVFDAPVRGLAVDSWRVSLDPPVMKQFRAAYYASINHVDNQIGRVLQELPENTIILFCSDHGEMLGDHQWIRKRSPYEPSARVPLLLNLPKSMNLKQECVIDKPVELMDVMPTLLEAAGVPIPSTVEGKSLLSLVRGNSEWREYVHGESSTMPTADTGMQYLTDGKRKYIWLPGLGQEQFFNLQVDPNELTNLAGDKRHADEIARWRSRLIKELKGRPEKFVGNNKLRRLNGPTPGCLPFAKKNGQKDDSKSGNQPIRKPSRVKLK